MITSVGWAFISIGLVGLLLVTLGYPMLVRMLAAVHGRSERSGTTSASSMAAPTVTIITAMRNAEALLPAKIESLAELVDPGSGIEVVLSSDGSTDRTVELARAACDSRANWHVLDEPEHLGKHCALHAAVARATGQILVFTDVDAVLEPEAVVHLVGAFSGPEIGGVCGQRMIGEASAFASSSQARYVELDSGLKGLESRIGSITSNDGKLYAIRADLYEEIPGGVTDDLFASMSVVRQGRRFLFEGRARAWIRTPSRSRAHELGRRRRIVCRSFRGMWIQRAVLNPFRTGLYAVGLLINKIGRRFLPFFLALVFLGTVLLAWTSKVALAVAVAQTVGLAVAWLGPRFLPKPESGRSFGLLGKVISLAHYALVGFAGTFLGVMDFVMARQVTRWDPIKSD
ncbi:Poly-beta-1,6-N-acetyl-D-glucosamine synthase [Planctomycetes bacterium Poly30]|uniref:Poly-beta-1,6-N-acetyl-D-glucosamine synthase n=1 Tax=Saltatorellus ferox TaxID=2528018 RepID=A0A518EM84_9BACT|nr:Poly-beta-1,6-N-acetyl-D-glucosamine synthase [Planctomycetes bacterium Poly30]